MFRIPSGSKTELWYAAAAAVLYQTAPVLLLGRPNLDAAPKNWKQCITKAAQDFGVSEKQLVKKFRNLKIDFAEDMPIVPVLGAAAGTDKQLLAIDALAKGASLKQASEYSDIALVDIEDAWAAAANGDDDAFGRQMRRAKAEYDLRVLGMPQQEKSRREAELSGAWQPTGQTKDTESNWNRFEAKAVIVKQQSFADVINLQDKKDKKENAKNSIAQKH